jgi:hypothetical protein
LPWSIGSRPLHKSDAVHATTPVETRLKRCAQQVGRTGIDYHEAQEGRVPRGHGGPGAAEAQEGRVPRGHGGPGAAEAQEGRVQRRAYEGSGAAAEGQPTASAFEGGSGAMPPVQNDPARRRAKAAPRSPPANSASAMVGSAASHPANSTPNRLPNVRHPRAGCHRRLGIDPPADGDRTHLAKQH